MASCAFSGIKLTAILYPSGKLLEFVMKERLFSFSVVLVCVDKLVAASKHFFDILGVPNHFNTINE